MNAYSMATCVGAMRIMNDRYWMNDELAGAAVETLSTILAYLTHQTKTGAKKNQHQTLVVPSYDGQTGIITMIHTLD